MGPDINVRLRIRKYENTNGCLGIGYSTAGGEFLLTSSACYADVRHR